MALGIPDKFPACGESEIADGFGAENPGFGLVGFFLFVFSFIFLGTLPLLG
jgi:hypothetical protein